MILAMTMMVRDEADIVIPMIEYHLAAGVDLFLITDNGSVDGTREILADYERDERVVVTDDPIQDKNQSAKVTAMARRAAAEYGADWVINADADEFFVPRNRDLRLRDLFVHMPKELGSATIPVVDFTGPPARRGAGIGRLIYRDERPLNGLYEATGLHAHATHDAFHVGDASVTVSQGNHYVSIASRGTLPPELEFESFHFPWRSYEQFEKKVRNAGEAYRRNPILRPSPRHHGVRDYRFLRAGALEDLYLYRHPEEQECSGATLPEDPWLPRHLAGLVGDSLVRNGAGVLAALSEPLDASYDNAEIGAARRRVPALLQLEDERATAESDAIRIGDRVEEVEHLLLDLQAVNRNLSAEINALRQERMRLDARLNAIYASRPYRMARSMSRLVQPPLSALRSLRERARRFAGRRAT